MTGPWPPEEGDHQEWGAALLAHGESTPAGGPAVPWWIVVMVVLGCLGYQWLVARRRGRSGRGWSRWRSASWTSGVLLVGVALSPALAARTDQASHHMLQHVLLGMFAPLGLVLAAPVSLLLGGLAPRSGRRVVAVLRSPAVHLVSHPVSAACLHTGLLLVVYLTPLLALSEEHTALHHALHLHFLAAGCLFAWAVAGPDPAPGRPGLVTRLGVLVLAAGVHAFLAKLLYSRGGQLPPGAGYAASEVQHAALLMYYAGDVAEVALAVAALSVWYRASAPRAPGRGALGRGRGTVPGRASAVEPRRLGT